MARAASISGQQGDTPTSVIESGTRTSSSRPPRRAVVRRRWSAARAARRCGCGRATAATGSSAWSKVRTRRSAPMRSAVPSETVRAPCRGDRTRTDQRGWRPGEDQTHALAQRADHGSAKWRRRSGSPHGPRRARAARASPARAPPAAAPSPRPGEPPGVGPRHRCRDPEGPRHRGSREFGAYAASCEARRSGHHRNLVVRPPRTDVLARMDHVLVDRPAPDVALVTLNRPERMNAMAFDVMVPLREPLRELGDDNEVRAVVLTGAGRGFCSGADQSGGAAGCRTSPASPSRPSRCARWRCSTTSCSRCAALHQPVIAAINGAAIGGGLCLALACDIRIAAEAAYFRAAGINNGLTASELGLSYLLPRAIGSSRAVEIMLTGRDVDAAEAERIGLVSRVVPVDELLDAAIELGDAHHRLQPSRRRADEAHAVVEPRRGQPGAAHERRGPRPALRAPAHRQLRGGGRRTVTRGATRSSATDPPRRGGRPRPGGRRPRAPRVRRRATSRGRSASRSSSCTTGAWLGRSLRRPATSCR